MANLVHVECPICHEDLEVSLTLINDSEGDGIYEHHFTAIDDYTIDWSAHKECQRVIGNYEVGKFGQTMMDDLNATIIEAGFRLIEAGDVHDSDPY